MQSCAPQLELKGAGWPVVQATVFFVRDAWYRFYYAFERAVRPVVQSCAPQLELKCAGWPVVQATVFFVRDAWYRFYYAFERAVRQVVQGCSLQLELKGCVLGRDYRNFVSDV